MMRKIFFIGMILFFSSGCLPHIGSLPERNYSDLPQKEAPEPSLFTQSELKEFFAREPAPAPIEIPPPPFTLTEESRLAWSLELPISDESNDDFNLEILPGDRRTKGKDLDIPIVILL